MATAGIDVVSPPEGTPALRVLASGSGGNCSVVTYRVDGWPRFCMIDAGLGPRKTLRLIRGSGLHMGQLDAIIVTHLDADHFNFGWLKARPPQTRLVIHAMHARDLVTRQRISVMPIEGSAAIAPGVAIHPIRAEHDEKGSMAMRLEFECGLERASLGFATDLGRVGGELIEHMRGVDVLAIESNYCPVMQRESNRPAFLKQRIMGGKGHLSNQEALAATEAISPREHCVLLHLSRQCNRPELPAGLHAGADYALTISSQHEPTRWVAIRGEAGRAAFVGAPRMRERQMSLFA